MDIVIRYLPELSPESGFELHFELMDKQLPDTHDTELIDAFSFLPDIQPLTKLRILHQGP
jgi:hypothetical protein